MLPLCPVKGMLQKQLAEIHGSRLVGASESGQWRSVHGAIILMLLLSFPVEGVTTYKYKSLHLLFRTQVETSEIPYR